MAFVGPFFIKADHDQQDNKAYIVIFSCGTSRAVHCFITPIQTVLASEFIDRLNESIAARSRSIQWEFIFTKSPWGGAFYERLNRDLKKMLYQKLGRSYVTFSGFSKVVKNIETMFNNRPIQYVEDELEPRVLTPIRIIHGRDVYLLQELEDSDTPSKMEKRIKAAKELMWKRWQTEYGQVLRERHDVTKTNPFHLETGEVVLVVADSKNRHEWHLGGGTSILGVHWGVPRVRVIVSRKNSRKGMSIFHKNSGKGYNICKKFQIGSVILMTQMTNQKNTLLIDFFDLVWTKNPQWLDNCLKIEAIFFPKQPSKSNFGDLH